MDPFTLWLVGWMFTMGLLGKDDFVLLATWPYELGKWVGGKHD